jgi:hypothetical protein
MANNRYKHKDYSNLLKELKNNSNKSNKVEETAIVESVDNTDSADSNSSAMNHNYNINMDLDYDLDSLISTQKNYNELCDFYDFCIEQIEREQLITQDLLHAIEFSDNYKERYKYSTQLHYNRVRRREYKNAVAVLKPLVEFIRKEENKKVFNRLSNILGEARKTKKHINEKTYSPRILEELGVITNGNIYQK